MKAKPRQNSQTFEVVYEFARERGILEKDVNGEDRSESRSLE